MYKTEYIGMKLTQIEDFIEDKESLPVRKMKDIKPIICSNKEILYRTSLKFNEKVSI